MQTKLKFGHDLSKSNIDLSKSLLEYVKVVTCICQVATGISCISCPNCGNALIDCMESILFNCCFLENEVPPFLTEPEMTSNFVNRVFCVIVHTINTMMSPFHFKCSVSNQFTSYGRALWR